MNSDDKKPLRVMVDMSASLLHHGHIRLLEKAKRLGHVIVALTTDDEIAKHKGYWPELTYEQRKELLLALRYVDEVVPSNWLLEEDYVRKHNADLLFHGDDNSNDVEKVQTVARTTDISSEQMRERALRSMVIKANASKVLLTPGPTNLHPENLAGIKPSFTRGDTAYTDLYARVLERIRTRAGQDSIICMQGSATTAIEVAMANFFYGNVLCVTSGYYSDRILQMLERKKSNWQIRGISYSDLLKEKDTLSGFDWVIAVYTETADAFLTDIKMLRSLCDRMKAKLMLDATGSINLEDGHELADVTMFSSCKGLGGLTGAGFITFNKLLLERKNTPNEFILDITTYIDKKTTTPAHALASLDLISDRFAEYGDKVKESKRIFATKFADRLVRQNNQPNLCTKVKANKVIVPPSTVMYQPRSIEAGLAVVCHLFDQFPANRKVGEFYDLIEIE